MRLRFLAPLLLLGSSLPAHAAGWYLLGAVSQSRVDLDKTALDAVLTRNSATGLGSSQSGTHDQWRLQLGYRFSPYVAIEGGYIDLGKAKYSATFNGGSATAKWQSGGIDVAGLGTLPLGHGIALLGKVGVIGAKTTTKWESSGISGIPSGIPSGSVNKTQSRPFVGIGVSYALNPRSRLRAEYEHFSNVGDAHLTGSANIDTFTLGMSYRF